MSRNEDVQTGWSDQMVTTVAVIAMFVVIIGLHFIAMPWLQPKQQEKQRKEAETLRQEEQRLNEEERQLLLEGKRVRESVRRPHVTEDDLAEELKINPALADYLARKTDFERRKRDFLKRKSVEQKREERQDREADREGVEEHRRLMENRR